MIHGEVTRSEALIVSAFSQANNPAKLSEIVCCNIKKNNLKFSHPCCPSQVIFPSPRIFHAS